MAKAAALVALAALAVIIAAYLISLRLHPRRPCRACEGSGKTRDRIWRKATGTCPACGGKGLKPRLGVRILTPERARRLTAGQPSRKSADQRRS